jgi:inner membrane protein
MEPVTHFLTGACIGRTGLNRRTAYATMAATLAAEAADCDILWRIRGPVEELKHHRGITHTFIAAPVVAGVVVGVVWLWHRWWDGRRKKKLAALGLADDFPPIRQKDGEWMGHRVSSVGPPLPLRLRPKTIRWGWMYLAALIAALSHLLLDWTNNYGVRPFFPFNPRWYAGSIVFIAEPVIWALLLLALVMPWLFGLADGEIGARKTKFRGRGWAIFALCGMVAVWGWRWIEQSQALGMLGNTQVAADSVKRLALEPYPVNPYRWHAILETAGYYQTAEVDTWKGTIDSSTHDVLYKPPQDAAVEAAKRTLVGQVYLDWGTWAVVRDMGREPMRGLDPPTLPPNRTWTTVGFSDMRFGYSYLGGERAVRNPLGAGVYIVDGSEDGGEMMGGKVQK